MKLIPENMPYEYVKEVIYEDRIIDLEFNVDEFSIERSEIDSFWSNIFYAEISYLERAQLSSQDCSLENYQLHVSNYDSNRMTVGVVIASFLRYQKEVCFGPVAHTTVTTTGSIISDQPSLRTKNYSAHMIPHVASLLAVAQDKLNPLDPRYIQNA